MEVADEPLAQLVNTQNHRQGVDEGGESMGGSPAPIRYSVGGKIVYKNSMCNPCVFRTHPGQAGSEREGPPPLTPATGLHPGLTFGPRGES